MLSMLPSRTRDAWSDSMWPKRTGRSVLMVTASEMATDARVCREAESLIDVGYDVRILCLSSSIPARIRGAELIERSYGHLPRRARLIAMTIDIFVSTVIRGADIYHAHNVPALPGCWVAARLRGSKLVYDAHELYALDVRLPKGTQGEHTRRQHFEAGVERHLGRRADARITASDKYAEVIAKAIQVVPPVAVPNYPPLPPMFKESPLRDLVGARDGDIVLLYQGGFYLSSRSLDTVVRGMRLLPSRYRLALLGFGVNGEELTLAALADDVGVADRVRVLAPVPHQDLARHTAGADIGIIPLRLTEDATRLCAPNKLYEYFQASVPVLSTAAEELAETLAAVGAGAIYEFDSERDFADQVIGMSTPMAGLKAQGARGRAVAETTYSWEAVSHTLTDTYRTLTR